MSEFNKLHGGLHTHILASWEVKMHHVPPCIHHNCKGSYKCLAIGITIEILKTSTWLSGVFWGGVSIGFSKSKFVSTFHIVWQRSSKLLLDTSQKQIAFF